MASARSDASVLAERYATALFELADEQKVLDQTAQDLKALQDMLEESADLRLLTKSPLIGREEQAKAIEAVAQRAGISDLVRKFLGAVASNRRLFVLPSMIKSFVALLARHRGEATAVVTTARPLNDSQKAALVKTLSESTGSKITLETAVDPALIGGMIVKIGSRLIDSSLRTKLERLEQVMKGVA